MVSTSLLKIIAKQVGVPIQEVIVRNDSPCGSTIGPILAAGTGIKTVDVGCAMLGMHSIRETCGILDGAYYQDVFTSFYQNFEKINHDLLDHWSQSPLWIVLSSIQPIFKYFKVC